MSDDMRTKDDMTMSDDMRSNGDMKMSDDMRTSTDKKMSSDLKMSDDMRTTCDMKTASNMRTSNDMIISNDMMTSGDMKTNGNMRSNGDMGISDDTMSDDMRTADDLLARLGFGKWNLVYLIAFTIWNFLVPLQILAGAYLVPSLPYTCRPPDNANVTTVADDSCSYEYVSEAGEVVEEPCKEWDFDNSVYSTSITADFSLVCHREFLRASFTSIFMVANSLIALVSGYLADRYGRHKVVVVSQVVFTCASFTVSFLNSLPAILTARLIQGLANTNTIFALSLEVCKIRHRAAVGILTTSAWALGTMTLGGMAYVIKDWRWLQVALSLPQLLIFPVLWFMDESPRWLMVAGRHQKALKVVHRAGRWNNASLPPDPQLTAVMNDIRKEAKRTKTKTERSESRERGCLKITAPDLCSRGVRLVLVVLCIDYFTAGIVYYGLNLNGANLSTDPYLYMVLSGLIEVPAYLFSTPLISKFGRKKITIIGNFLCGASILILVLIPKELGWVKLVLSLCGKMCISSVYIVILVYSTELLPTEVRIQGMGLAKVFARSGSMLSPFITDLLGVWWAPSVVFGGVAMVASVATLWAPETKGIPLPDAISHLQRRVHAHTSAKRGEGESKKMQDLKASYKDPAGGSTSIAA